MDAAPCSHLNHLHITKPTKHVCEDCIKLEIAGYTCACVLTAAMWDAVTLPRTGTPASMPGTSLILWPAPLSREKLGCGATWTKL